MLATPLLASAIAVTLIGSISAPVAPGALGPLLPSDPRPEPLYGTVTTSDGRSHRGFLRWDENETSTHDFLDGLKEIPWAYLRQAESLDPEYGAEMRMARSIEAFGVRITWDRDDSAGPPTSRSAIQYRHIRSIVPLDRFTAELSLVDGSTVALQSVSSDLGRGLTITVETPSGALAVPWRELARVDFARAAQDAVPESRRLFGTLTTEDGERLTGVVAWDRDEMLATDVLDGSAEDGTEYSIAMGEIAEIRRESSRSARVLLHDGTDLVLRGSNDVDRQNRGIELSGGAIPGRALVSWSEFRSLRFHDPTPDAVPSGPVGIGPLQGVVRANDGRVLEGRIRWDNDESAGWELLDGAARGIEYGIELGRIERIAKRARGGAEVTLRSGEVLELVANDDVGTRNRGVYVTDGAGRSHRVAWAELVEVVLRW